MPDGWEWDRTLFQGSAAHYERGRLPYAPGFPEAFAEALGLDGRGRLLDVGCGPGTVLLPMARFFTEAVGVDPDEDMLSEAGRQAGRRGVTNARWVAARAEDLPAGLGAFRAVVFAQSFHWTDRDRVAATVLEMLDPGGALVHVSDLKHPLPEPPPPPLPAPPYDRIADLVRRYLGPLRRAGQGVLVNGTPGGEELIIERAGFRNFARLVVPAGKSSPAPRTTSSRGRSPDPIRRRTCWATDSRTSNGTCVRCWRRRPPTTASRSAFRPPRSGPGGSLRSER